MLPSAALLQTLNRAAEQLWQQLSPGTEDLSVEVLDQVDSTNDELMRRVRSGQPIQPTLLTAVEQTSGRGRRGRSWVATPGEALCFSYLRPWPLHVSLEGLSVSVGLAMAEAMHAEVQIKWPNDWWWRGRKLGGMLIESARGPWGQALVVGVGINLRAPALMPGHGGVEPAGLCDIDAQLSGDPGHWWSVLANSLHHELERFIQRGLGPRLSALASRDALLDQTVALSDGTTGIARGINASGALQIQTASGLQSVISHEVSLRLA